MNQLWHVNLVCTITTTPARPPLIMRLPCGLTFQPYNLWWRSRITITSKLGSLGVGKMGQYLLSNEKYVTYLYSNLLPWIYLTYLPIHDGRIESVSQNDLPWILKYLSMMVESKGFFSSKWAALNTSSIHPWWSNDLILLITNNTLSSFFPIVLHVEIQSKQKERGDQMSYDVEIISTYKNTMHIGHREYLWVPNRCNCPRLKPGRQYIVTGNQRYFAEIGESRLVVDRDNLVSSWKAGLHNKWDKIQANDLILCQSETRTE